MGNTCHSKLRDSQYSNIDQDGAPYYRPRTISSQFTSDSDNGQKNRDKDLYNLKTLESARKNANNRYSVGRAKFNLST